MTMNNLRSYRSKLIMAAVNMNSNAEDDIAETNECFPTNSLELNAPSTSYAHDNTHAASDPDLLDDIQQLITISDLDDSLEDPNFVLLEENESDKDTSVSESEPILRNYLMTSSLNPTLNDQFKANFIAAYPGPVYISDEHVPDSDLSLTSQPQLLQTSQQKLKAKHPMIQNSCDSKCKRQCATFSLESRKNIWEEYWNLSFLSRRSFLNKCIKISKIKRRKVEASNGNETFFKNESRYFFLPNCDGILTSVCKKFFLATLGHKTDGVITELSKAVKKGKLYGSVTKEKRGGNRKKIDGSVVINHIMTFQPTVSHYRRHNAPFTKYLPRHLTLQHMYTDFKQRNPNFKCGREIYRQKIKELKISFHMPKGDRCVECALHEEELKKYNDATLMPEELKIKYEDHRTKADSSIQRYRLNGNNKNSNIVKFVSMDLQKVIILPEMPDIKDAFFMSRLSTFNLTFSPIEKKSDDNSTCVVWHEAIAGREASDIVNALYAFIECNRDMQHLHLWADNCTAQNKNWTLYTAMTMIVNNPSNSLESVTVNYLTKGHTHMSADAVHGNIEMKMKREKNVYDFQDFKDIVMKSRKNIKVIEVTKKYEWPKKKRTARQNEPLKEFNLNSVVQVKMVTGSRNLFYLTSFNEPLVELDFLMKKFNCKLPPADKDVPRGIKREKKQEIITKLVSLMPESRRAFWHNLPVNDLSIDLTSDGQLDAC